MSQPLLRRSFKATNGRLSSSAPRPKARYSRGIDDSTLERSEDAVISEQRDSSRASFTTSALSAGTSAFFRKKVAGKGLNIP